MAEERKSWIGPKCEVCGKVVRVGQVVLVYDDAGEIHADCEDPFSLDVAREPDSPEPVLLLGSPLRHHRLSALLDREVIANWLRELAHTQTAVAVDLANHGLDDGFYNADAATRYHAAADHVERGDYLPAPTIRENGRG